MGGRQGPCSTEYSLGFVQLVICSSSGSGGVHMRRVLQKRTVGAKCYKNAQWEQSVTKTLGGSKVLQKHCAGRSAAASHLGVAHVNGKEERKVTSKGDETSGCNIPATHAQSTHDIGCT